jgi:small GTP-binding protein
MTPNNPASRGNRPVPTIDYNIVVLGSAGVGKSSMISRYTTGHFSRGYTPTIEERYRKEQTIAGRRYRVAVLDTMGHRDKAEILDSHTFDQQGVLIVFDLGNENSFRIACMLAEKLSMTMMDEPIILVGNKSEFAQNDRAVTEEEIEDCMGDYGLRDYIECSAATDADSVMKVFKELLNHIIEDRQDHIVVESTVKYVAPSEINNTAIRKQRSEINQDSLISPSNSVPRPVEHSQTQNGNQPTIIRKADGQNRQSGQKQGQEGNPECTIM